MAIIEITSEEHFNLIKDEKLVIFDFWAEWCTPCIAFLPTFLKYSNIYEDLIVFAKINIDDFEQITNKYDLSVFPSFLFFKDGILWEARSIAFIEKDFAHTLNKFLKEMI